MHVVALFLALATTQPQHIELLLFDDPVQNMDEMHIEEFVSVLKSIKDDLGWQIILATHDESVFRYLKRELYPSQKGQSLISYLLQSGDEGSKATVDKIYAFDPKDFYTVADSDAA